MNKTPIRRGRIQLNLFRSRPQAPAWSTLPSDTRRKVKSLLARLLREHRKKSRDRQEMLDE